MQYKNYRQSEVEFLLTEKKNNKQDGTRGVTMWFRPTTVESPMQCFSNAIFFTIKQTVFITHYGMYIVIYCIL